jgi:hypothetical protein
MVLAYCSTACRLRIAIVRTALMREVTMVAARATAIAEALSRTASACWLAMMLSAILHLETTAAMTL